MWDAILNGVTVQTEARILNLNDNDTLYLLLGKCLSFIGEQQEQLLLNIAKHINNLMFVI